MARTKGSKNKPKTITITASEKNFMDKTGVTPTELAKAKKAITTKNKIDWEKLAKQLQQALAMEMKENEDLKKRLIEANKLAVQMSGIIEYLEIKSGNNPV